VKRIHGLLIALALGVAAVAGTFAAVQTTSLGAQAATVSDAEIAARSAKLDRAQEALRRAANRRSPGLSSASTTLSVSEWEPGEDDDEHELEDADELEHEDEHELEDEDGHHGRGGEDDD
jgi:hypothetical protein